MPLSSLTPIDGSGLRGAPAAGATRLPVKNNSRLVYDIAGKGFTRLRGSLDVENDRAEIGSTLNPALRFFVFDAEPNMDRLLPPSPELPMPRPGAGHHRPRRRRPHLLVGARPRAVGGGAAGRRKRRLPIRRGRASRRPTAVADLLWAVLMKPEFQLIY